MSRLQERFFSSVQSFTDAPPARLAPIFEVLDAAYNEPHRAYHTWEHIAEMLALFDECENAVEAGHELAVAIYYHDAVYDPAAGDNEEQSAALCRAHLEAVDVELGRRERIAQLVLATKHLGRIDAERPDNDQLEAVLLDIDLGILGSPRERYERYTRQVREEYRHLTDRAFLEGRRRVVAHFLAMKRLYRTPYFAARFAARARENLARELEALDSPWV
ncbi:MAG: hypothetical protein ACLFNT_06310 [Spirochaetales bacterium]